MPAPEISISEWFNTAPPRTLASLSGQVVMLHCFQMLCPGCVMQATPQAVRMWLAFRAAGLEVIGLHTVFEHHEVMTPAALAVYLAESETASRITRSGGSIPAAATGSSFTRVTPPGKAVRRHKATAGLAKRIREAQAFVPLGHAFRA